MVSQQCHLHPFYYTVTNVPLVEGGSGKQKEELTTDISTTTRTFKYIQQCLNSKYYICLLVLTHNNNNNVLLDILAHSKHYICLLVLLFLLFNIPGS